MTLYQYKLLGAAQQQELLWEHGALVAEQHEGIYLRMLYQLESFYVELWYHRQCNTIRKWCSFSSTDLLTSYLETIDLSSLL